MNVSVIVAQTRTTGARVRRSRGKAAVHHTVRMQGQRRNTASTSTRRVKSRKLSWDLRGMSRRTIDRLVNTSTGRPSNVAMADGGRRGARIRAGSQSENRGHETARVARPVAGGDPRRTLKKGRGGVVTRQTRPSKRRGTGGKKQNGNPRQSPFGHDLTNCGSRSTGSTEPRRGTPSPNDLNSARK